MAAIMRDETKARGGEQAALPFALGLTLGNLGAERRSIFGP
jgi:hypothetical protein